MGHIQRLLLITLFAAISATAEPLLFDGQLAMQHIVNQLAYGPREPGNQKAKQGTLAYIEQTLQPLDAKLNQQTFSAYDLQGTNLWASFPADGNIESTKQRIMLGAHWDTRPHADRDRDKSQRLLPVPGANDGASGVAVLLEMARLLAARPAPITVDLIFFDLEDMGEIGNRPFSIGARQFIATNPSYRPSAGIIVDMVCDKNLSIPRELYSQTRARPLMDQLWAIAKRQGARAFKNRPGHYISDDHLPFLEAGIPVVDLIHYPFPAYWHSTEDSIDKCSGDSLKQVGNVLSDFIYTYGQNQAK
ncbi:M28 family peptidase [Porticoccaceae bacterium]|mgnify:FL=1|jgi:Zn-dependent M28 family amino/carboxypeptidase|nr:M28 family peptidase [Porticoccaceae bacterium]MDB2594403.1 M28 family peptidase [Porticoccaceae bacterium]